jgi:hypothetical protein
MDECHRILRDNKAAFHRLKASGTFADMVLVVMPRAGLPPGDAQYDLPGGYVVMPRRWADIRHTVPPEPRAALDAAIPGDIRVAIFAADKTLYTTL